MPDFMQLFQDLDFVHDFGAVEAQQPSSEMMARPVHTVMLPPRSVDETSGLLRAFAMLHQHDINDLPVVNSREELVGIASHVDIATALLARWQASKEKRT